MKYVIASSMLVAAFVAADRAVAAIICTYRGEQVSGMNKICYYDCLGSPAAIAIPALELCPLSIRR